MFGSFFVAPAHPALFPHKSVMKRELFPHKSVVKYELFPHKSVKSFVNSPIITTFALESKLEKGKSA